MTKQGMILLCGLLLGMGKAAWAVGDGVASAPSGKPEGHPPHEHGFREPPPEAFAACKGLGQGNACTVNTPHGKLNGQCKAPEGKALACLPDMPPRGGQAGSVPPKPDNN